MSEKQFQQLQDDVMTGYLNCSFGDVFPQVITDSFMSLGKKTNPFRQCLSDHPGIIGILKCLPTLQRACYEAKAVVLKTLRYTMKRALTLMARDSKVKVIHLIRDPRGTLRGQMVTGLHPHKAVGNYSREFCAGVLKDLAMVDQAKKRFPERLIRVRYEDIALQPVTFARKLLAFAGLSLSDRHRKYLEKMTNATNVKICHNCINVLKTNSSASAFLWRRESDFYHTSRIDASCGQVYKRAGYLPLNRKEELLNMTVPSMLMTGSVPGFLA